MSLLISSACDSGSDGSADVALIAKDERAAELAIAKEAVVPFFQTMHVEHGDWLKDHPEDGQTFAEYLEESPTLPTAERRSIYIQPIGTFTAEQKKVLQLTSDYMTAFFGLPVRLQRERKLENVPAAMTKLQYPNNRQVRTSYFLDTLLPKLLPTDAAALICFTNSDIYPDDQWNYVFGQATLEDRVGVYSLYRLGEKSKSQGAFDKFLDRTLKIAMHETGHMFSMRHCTKYNCLMSGSNHLGEIDRRPLDVCPECMAKIAWAMKYDPVERYKKLASFWGKIGRIDEQKKMLQKAAAVQAAKGR